MTRITDSTPSIAFDLSGVRKSEANTLLTSKTLATKLGGFVEKFIKSDQTESNVKLSRKYQGERQAFEFTATKKKVDGVVTVFLFSKK